MSGTGSSLRNLRTGLVVLTAWVIALVGPVSTTTAFADTAPGVVPQTYSADTLPTWQINGVVWSQVLVGNTVYVTGEFSRARPPGVPAGGAGEIVANNIFAYDIRTGNRVASFNHSLNSKGRTITASPNGSRIYVGGNFTSVDGYSRPHVAAFDTTTGHLNAAIRPNVNGTVRALSATDSTLFVGGDYTAVNGLPRTDLSAVNLASGALLPWAPTVDNGLVWSMVVAPGEKRVIVGGSFTTLNTQAAYGMGSLDASNGTVQPWAANKTIRNATTSGAITSLRTDGTQIYGSGYAFGAGSSFEGTFGANPTTGAISFLNDCHGDTYDVLPVRDVLYSVSHVHDCRAIRGFPDINPRPLTQRTLAQQIKPTTTNVGPDSYGWNYNGWPASKNLQWFPNLTPGTFTGQAQAAWSLAGNASYISLGGEFPTANGVAQQGLVRLAVPSLAPNKVGPTYARKASTSPIPATTATSPTTGSITVTFGTAWDYDNELLTYELLRDNAVVVYTTQVRTNWWTLPTRTFTNTGLASGSRHQYQVRIKDPFGNLLMSPKSAVVVTK